jgi:chaperonin GroEL (HSP60 family)
LLLSIAEKVSLTKEDILRNIAITAMTGKGAEANRDHLAHLILNAVKRVALHDEKGVFVHLDDIKIERRVGISTHDSKLIDGIVLDKEVVHPSMPQLVHDAKVALLDASLEIKNTEIDAKIQITDPLQLNSFLDQEERTLREMVNKVKLSGATVLFCQRGIDDLAQHFLAKEGILATRRVKKSDMDKLARATGGRVVSSWKELSTDDLGFAGVVKQEKIGEEEMIFVEECKNPKAVTLLVCGGTDHVTEEVKRAVTDALGDLAAALRDGFVVAGAGATEMELARGLRSYSSTLHGREQLAVQAFAEAMEIIPRTLAENAGLDPLDVLTKLRVSHDQKQQWAGINVFTGDVMNAWSEGVIEPLKIKTLALSSATDVAEMILRIDDVILGGRSSHPPRMPPNMDGMM